MVIDPVILQKEIQQLEELNVDVQSKLLISKKAHLILPTHKLLDQASEIAKGKQKDRVDFKRNRPYIHGQDWSKWVKNRRY